MTRASVGEWVDPNPPPPPPPPDIPVVPFGTVLTRLLVAGGIEGLQTLLTVLTEAEVPEGEEPPALRLLNALEGIAPDDASARALLVAANFDPDVILRMEANPNGV